MSDSSLKKIKAFESEWREAWRDKNERYTPIAARDEFNKQMASDKPAQPDGFKNLLSDYEAKTQRAEFKMKQIDEDSLPLVKSILQDFIDAGEIWIAERVKSEKNEAAEFGVAFSPVAWICITAQRLVASYKIRTQNLSPFRQKPDGPPPISKTRLKNEIR